jgi:hypothetical protein
MSFLARAALCVALLVSGGVLAPTAASADSERVHDESRDVVRTWWTGCEAANDDCVEHHRTDPTRRFADITWSRHTFTKHRLLLRMKLSDIIVRRQVGTYVGWEVRGPHGSGLSTQVLFDGGAPSTDLISYTRDGYECDGARTTVRRKTGVFTLIIPRRCLSGMPWVRIAAGVMVQDFRTARIWHDDPRVGDDLKIQDSVAADHFGPRLHPG